MEATAGGGLGRGCAYHAVSKPQGSASVTLSLRFHSGAFVLSHSGNGMCTVVVGTIRGFPKIGDPNIAP